MAKFNFKISNKSDKPKKKIKFSISLKRKEQAEAIKRKNNPSHRRSRRGKYT